MAVEQEAHEAVEVNHPVVLHIDDSREELTLNGQGPKCVLEEVEALVNLLD